MKEIQNFRAYPPQFWNEKGIYSFESALRYGKLQGLRPGMEINFARHVDPPGYNKWVKAGRPRTMEHKPTHVMDMRTRSGAPLIRTMGV